MATPALPLDDIQGYILRGYRYPCGRFQVLTFSDPAATRSWLGSICPRISDATPWDDKPASVVNIAFGAAGLRKLGVAEATLNQLAPEFLAGMAARAHAIGDVGPNAPEQWEQNQGSPEAAAQRHALLLLYAQDQPTLESEAAALQTGLSAAGITVLWAQDVGRLPAGREHFGFLDGVGQPAVDGFPCDPGDGLPLPGGGWRPLATGEFLLGYANESNPAPTDLTPLAQNGTYMVLRKLQQDVAAFRSYLNENLWMFPGKDADWLGSRIIGRWPDGTPVTLSPDAPNPELASDPARINDFRYFPNDANGACCPVGSHIRRANPRDGAAGNATASRFRRIIRRGMPFGPPLAPGCATDDGVERGLLFLGFNADLGDQFEFLQTQWMYGSGNLPATLASQPDPVLGNPAAPGTGRMAIPGNPTNVLLGLPQFVRLRFGEYFFVPGLAACRTLAAGGEL